MIRCILKINKYVEVLSMLSKTYIEYDLTHSNKYIYSIDIIIHVHDTNSHFKYSLLVCLSFRMNYSVRNYYETDSK